jgi:outer membrane protein assembly factor BamA
MLAMHQYPTHRPTFTTILSAIVILVASGTLQAQQTRRLVEEVDVIGYRRLAKEDILKNVKTRPGEPYSSKRVQRDLQAILSLGLFNEKGTRVLTETGRRGGVVVIFEVQELPLILDVQFEGLPEGVRATEIERVLHDEHINVVKNAVDDSSQVRQASRAIQSYLASRGWPDAKVTVQQENVTSMSVNLTFVISFSKDLFLALNNAGK